MSLLTDADVRHLQLISDLVETVRAPNSKGEVEHVLLSVYFGYRGPDVVRECERVLDELWRARDEARAASVEDILIAH